jgi:NAD(P)-dependent dehydrogenase (short-subunit alcohol dehydrogenase family)
MDVAGRVALVTGAAGGLGEATARLLHAKGASLVLFDRDRSRVQSLAEALGARAVAIAGDATNEGEMGTAVDAATAQGGLRLVVACAGGAAASARTVSRDGKPHDLALFVDTLNLNLVSTFNTIRLAAAAMASLEPMDQDGERGAIVMTASIAGIEGQVGQIAYGTAKAGLIGMTLIAARDLAAAGIRINTIAPGTIRTQAWDAAPAEVRTGLERKVPFPQRFGAPEEFASLAIHLLTNRYLNGEVVRLDGAVRFGPR